MNIQSYSTVHQNTDLEILMTGVLKPEYYRQPELMGFRNMMGLGGQPLVLGPTVDTYAKYG